MKRILILILALLVLSPMVTAEEVKSQLAATMSQIESSIKELKKNIKQDASREANLAEVERLIVATEKALSLDPTASRGMEEGSRQRFLVRYQAAMTAMLADARTLRKMIVEGADPIARYDQLMKTYRHQESGHESFQNERTP